MPGPTPAFAGRARRCPSEIPAAARVTRLPRCGAIRAPEEWPSRRATSRQNPAYRPAGNVTSDDPSVIKTEAGPQPLVLKLCGLTSRLDYDQFGYCNRCK